MLVHPPIIGINASQVKACLPQNKRHHLRVTKTHQILAENLKTLMARTPDLETQAKVAAEVKVNQTTIGYVIRATHSPRVDLVEKLAVRFRVKPWQMLAPELGAHKLISEDGRRLALKFDAIPNGDQQNAAYVQASQLFEDAAIQLVAPSLKALPSPKHSPTEAT